MFGGGATRPARHNLDLTFSLAEAHDSDSPTEAGADSPAATPFDGYSTMLTGNVDYRWDGSRVQFRVGEASAVRYLNDAGELRVVSHTAAAGVSANLGSRTSVLLNQTVAYSPSDLYSLFPSDSVVSPGIRCRRRPITTSTTSFRMHTAPP